MASTGAQPRSSPGKPRRIAAVGLIVDGEPILFRVEPAFVYRDGMRLRIDILSQRAFVAEVA